VDTDSFSPAVDGSATRRAYGLGPDDLVVVSAGRLKPRKGMRELIGAFDLVHQRDRRARLLIVGSTSSASSDYAAALEQDVERLRLQDAVTIDRGVTFDRMPSVLAAADVVAQPSWEEGLGLSVLEAMSSGRAVVTTDVPGVREIVAGEDVALVVPPKQVRPLAGALTSLLESHALRRRLGDRGRRHVVERFSRDLMLKETEAALELLVAEGERPAVANV
jgi:glycosyltransferase involved in cell wall biosynthesis